MQTNIISLLFYEVALTKEYLTPVCESDLNCSQLSQHWHSSYRNSINCDWKCRSLDQARCGICEGLIHAKCNCYFKC